MPLYRGAERALERPAGHATDVHGESGLDGTKLLPKPECEPIDKDAVEAMYETLMSQAKGTAYIVAVGALTNLDALLRRHPDVVAHLKGISIMGGSFGDGFSDAPVNSVDGVERVGNVGLWAEFNVLADPEAAAELFHNPESAKITTVVPLDLSHQVLTTLEVRQRILYGDGPREGKGKTTLRTMLVDLLNFVAKTHLYVSLCALFNLLVCNSKTQLTWKQRPLRHPRRLCPP